MNYRTYFIFLFIFCLTSLSVQADYDYLEMTSSFSEQAEEHTKRHFDDETLQKLYEYRLAVQEEAYKTTMQLCAGYRYFIGEGAPRFHKKMSSGFYMNHPDEKVRNWARQMSEKYGDVVSSSFQAWAKLGYEGGAQPVSGMFGMKADYLNLRSTSMAETEYWIKSLYALYLVNSLGFLQAATHCLGTIDKSSIDRFATSIFRFDAMVSGASYGVLFAAGEGVFHILWQATKWTFRPVGKATALYAKKFNKALASSSNPFVRQNYMKTHTWLSSLSSRQKKAFIAAGVTAAAVLAGSYVYNRISEKNELEEAVLKALTDEFDKPEGYLERSMLFGDAVYLFTAIYEEHDLADKGDIECLECLDVFIPLNDFLRDHFDEETFFLMKEDYQFLKETETMGFRDQFYFQTLGDFLPLFEKMHQTQS